MNHCIFVGNLTADPVCKTIQAKSGNGEHKVLNFSIGVNDRRNKETCFPELQAWGSGAEMIEKHFKKGKLIRVYCRLAVDKWQDEDGKNRYRNYFKVDNFDFPEVNKFDGAEDDATPTPAPEAEAKPKAKAGPKVTNKPPRPKPENPPIEETEEEADDQILF